MRKIIAFLSLALWLSLAGCESASDCPVYYSFVAEKTSVLEKGKPDTLLDFPFLLLEVSSVAETVLDSNVSADTVIYYEKTFYRRFCALKIDSSSKSFAEGDTFYLSRKITKRYDDKFRFVVYSIDTLAETATIKFSEGRPFQNCQDWNK